jgi:vacuolar-type H+-ATPase subunit F/Vma7
MLGKCSCVFDEANPMPLLHNARDRLRVNLQKISVGKRVKSVLIGHLTTEQLTGVNAFLAEKGFSPISNEVFFRGEHVYDSRITKDGYSIDDVIEQITNGMDASSIPIKQHIMSAIRNETERIDRFGKAVKDTIVFRCAGRSNPELYSVIPKGDICPADREKLETETKEATPVDGL